MTWSGVDHGGIGITGMAIDSKKQEKKTDDAHRDHKKLALISLSLNKKNL